MSCTIWTPLSRQRLYMASASSTMIRTSMATPRGDSVLPPMAAYRSSLANITTARPSVRIANSLAGPGSPGPASEFAILTLGRAVVMFAKDDLYAAMGGSTESPRGVAIDVRIMVDDADAMYNRCRESGVQIVHDIADRSYGQRLYMASASSTM